MTLKLNQDIIYILDTINKNGFEGFVVGGCVRDYLMGTEPKDYDITTSAKPEEIKLLFNKTIDTGIDHGTVTVVINKENYEVTTYRIDGDYEDNRKPKEVFFTEDIIKDLERRDFTMNAIAYNRDESFIDPFFGQRDIENKLIRGVGIAEIRFQEDALRMFRALRFSVQLGFDIEDKTYKAILKENKLVKSLSVERVREEFTKLLIGKYLENFKYIIDTKLFYYYKEDFHSYLKDNLEYIYPLLLVTKNDYIIRYSILLSRMGHEKAKELLKFFKFDNNTIKETYEVIRCLNEIENNYNDIYTRKLLNIYGFKILDYVIYIKEVCFNENYEDMKNHIIEVKEKKYPLLIKDLKINGNDLKSMGIVKGVEIGKTLNKLLQAVLEKPELNEKQKLIDLIKD